MSYLEFTCQRTMMILATIAALVAPGKAQSAQPVCPSDTKAVNVLATVRNKHGVILSKLPQSDFALAEDGHPQTIRCFIQQADFPLTLGFLVDTASNQNQNLDQERTSSTSFAHHMLRDDRDKTFLIRFDRETELLQDLTPSKQKLDTAFNALQAPQLKRQDDPSSDDSYPSSRGPGRSQRSGNATLLYDAIYLGSTELMQKQAGRKVIVVLSDGVDRGSRMTLAQAIESAQRADVLVYSIMLSSKAESENNAGGWGRGGGMGGGRRGGRFPSPQQQSRPDGKKTLQRISKETGGRMFEVTKKLTADQIYEQIEEDLLNQYSLNYIPDRTADSSEYHKIQLTVKDKASVVQTREGYYPSKQPDVKQN